MIWQSGPVWRNPEKLFRVKKTYDTWQEGLVQIFEAVYENKTLVQNACHAIGREKIENYLFKLTHDLIMGVVQEQSAELSITEETKKFYCRFL